MFVICSATVCAPIVCKKKTEIVEKMNIIRKKIKQANKIDKITEPIRHKIEWKQIYSLTNELRRDIDCHEINYKKYEMAFDIDTSSVSD